MTNTSQPAVLRRTVKAKGNLLNDNDAGVDHLEQGIYAEAICESIHNVETPITIGLFARWGSGKTFLVKHIQSNLRKNQLQAEIDNNQTKSSTSKLPRCRKFRTFIFLAMFVLIAVGAIFLIAIPSVLFQNEVSLPAETTQNTPTTSQNVSILQTYPEITTVSAYDQKLRSSQIVGVVTMSILVALVMFLTCCCGRKATHFRYYGQFKILLYAMFTKIPIVKSNSSLDVIGDPGEAMDHELEHASSQTSISGVIHEETGLDTSTFPRKYIFATFRAWEFAGSDSLWAGIVTNISDALEAEFGIVTTRLFRTIIVDTIDQEEMMRKNINVRVIYIKLRNRHDAIEISKEYGVVKKCTKTFVGNKYLFAIEYSKVAEARSAIDSMKIKGLTVAREISEIEILSGAQSRSWRVVEDEQWFEIEYSKVAEARSACDSMKIKGMEVERENNEEHIAETSFIQTGNIEAASSLLNGSRPTSHKETEATRRQKKSKDRSSEYLMGTPGFWKYYWRQPALLCCCPYLIWIILFVVCVVLIPILIFILTKYLDLTVVKTYKSFSAQLLLWLPGTLSVVFVGIRFIWAMLASQRNRVQKALDGVKSNMAAELGFMSKVKEEVEIMTRLLQCANFVLKKDHKVVITIDDLDRVQLNQVKSVLEAVSILLSDKAAPFICLVAVDSRIAVKCIEEDMGEALVKANVTGHEYIKKIINLPVCLPQVENTSKKRFISGLVDQADKTTKTRKKQETPNTPSDSPSKSDLPPSLEQESNDSIGSQAPSPQLDSLPNLKQGSDDSINLTIFIETREMVCGGDEVAVAEMLPWPPTDGAIDTNDGGSFSHGSPSPPPLRGNEVPAPAALPPPSPPGTTIVRTPHSPNKVIEPSHPSPSRTSAKSRDTPVSQVQEHTHPGIQYRSLPYLADGHTAEHFLFHCRKVMISDSKLHSYLDGSPRNIKRIFNIISLTAGIIKYHQLKERRRDIYEHARIHDNNEVQEIRHSGSNQTSY